MNKPTFWGLLIIALCFVHQSHAQFVELTCDEKAELILNHQYEFENYDIKLIDEMIAYIAPCADLNLKNPKAHYSRGLLHQRKGDKFYLFGTWRERSFHHINYAANQGYAPAAYTHAMNILTKKYSTRGSASAILNNFNKALAQNYKADVVHYALGYAKLKNLVSNYRIDYTPANYIAEAKNHFELSNHPMAKHWLAIMHYLGYGTPEDKSKAFQMLSENNVLNSKTLLPHLQSLTNDWIPISAEERLISLENFNTLAAAETIINGNVNDVTKFQGHFLEYDWTAKGVRRYIPMTLELLVMKEQSNYKEVRYELTMNGTTITGLSRLQNRFGNVILGFSSYGGLTFSPLQRLLQDHPDKSKVTYEINALYLKETTINNKQALVAEVYFGYDEAMILEFDEEIRQPLRMVLYPETPVPAAASIADTLLKAAPPLSLDKNFATISPNPIGNEFTITYTLDQEARVQVSVYDFFGQQRINLPSQKYTSGETQTITVDSAVLLSGTYVIQMIIDGTPYSKMVIKE